MKKFSLLLILASLQLSAYPPAPPQYQHRPQPYYYYPEQNLPEYAPYMPDNGPMRGPNANIGPFQPHMTQQEERAMNQQHQQEVQSRAYYQQYGNQYQRQQSNQRPYP